MKNDLWVFLLENLVRDLLAMLQSLCNDLLHLDEVSAKAGLPLSSFDPVFALNTKATRWCQVKQTQ